MWYKFGQWSHQYSFWESSLLLFLFWMFSSLLLTMHMLITKLKRSCSKPKANLHLLFTDGHWEEKLANQQVLKRFIILLLPSTKIKMKVNIWWALFNQSTKTVNSWCSKLIWSRKNKQKWTWNFSNLSTCKLNHSESYFNKTFLCKNLIYEIINTLSKI